MASAWARPVENYHTMLHVAQEHGDLPMQVSALNKLGWVTALMQGQFPEAEEHLVDAERLALECDDLSGLAELHMTYCYLRIPFGNFEDAVDHLNESDRIGRELDLEEPRLFGLTHKAQTLLYMTRFEDAWAVTQEAVHLAKELGNRKWLSELVGFPTAFYHLRNGDLDATSETAEQGLNIAAQIGAVEQEGYGSFMAGLTSWPRGDYERAISFQERTAQTGRACGFPFIEAMGLCALGTAYLEVCADLLDKTAELHGQAMKLLETPMGAVMDGLAWSDLGFCALAVGDVEAAGDLFDKGLSASNATKLLARPQLLVGSAFVALMQGNADGAKTLVRQSRQFAEEREMRFIYPAVAFAEAQVSGAVHPVGNRRPGIFGYRLDEIVQAFVLADGDGEAHVQLAADGDHAMGVEAAVGPHRELSPGPAVAHPPHRFPQEVGGAAGGVGAALTQPGHQHVAGSGGNGQQRVIAPLAGIAVVAGALLGQSVGLADRRIKVDGERCVAGSGPSRPGLGQQLPAHPVQLADMAPPETAQEGAQGGGRLDRAAQGAGCPPGAQHIGVVNTIAASQRRRNQGHHLVARVGPARRIAQVEALLDELGQAEAQGEGGRKDQPGIGHQAVIVEGDTDAVGVVAW